MEEDIFERYAGYEDAVGGLKDNRARRRVLRIPAGTKRILSRAFMHVKATSIILPPGLEEIQRKAFAESKLLRRIYIPASVTTIGDDAFCDCPHLEIYCEGAPQPGWLDEEETRKETVTDMTDAFNFHRSGGSFDDLYLVTQVEITHNKYNPDRLPVHTGVSLAAFEALVGK